MELVKPPPVEMVVHRDAVEILESALALAKAGEIDGAVILLSHTDGTTSDRWGTGKGFWWVKMLGAAEVWKKRYIDKFEETTRI